MPAIKKALNPLPKSMRERTRYVLIEFDGAVDEREFKRELNAIVLELFGSVGAAEFGLRTVKFGSKEKQAVIKVSRGSEDKLRVALIFLSEQNKSLESKYLRVSGTIKGLRGSI